MPGKGAIDQDKLDAALDSQIGGAGTCVVIDDVKTGAVVYQYGAKDVCGAPLPPCATFDVPMALICLDAGVVTPKSIYKWDGARRSQRRSFGKPMRTSPWPTTTGFNGGGKDWPPPWAMIVSPRR